MKLISVNVGVGRDASWQGKQVRTSIWKSAVHGRVRVFRLNVEGDRQSDLAVHGGVEMAVYAYPAEHYSYWRRELPGVDLPWGAFGENFTTEGLLEDEVKIGDRFRCGSAEFMVTKPRMPCYKLALRLDRADVVKRFLHSRRSGFYLEVLREGDVAAGDPIDRAGRGQDGALTVAETVSLYVRKKA